MIYHRTLSRVVYSVFPHLIWQKPNQENILYLTFDDGPHPVITKKILHILEDFNVKATFFVLGENIVYFRHQLFEINYQGHQLGNHGYFHHAFLLLSKKIAQKEIRLTDKLIEKYFNFKTLFFRPPFGMFGPNLKKTSDLLDKKIVLWSIMSNDYKWNGEKVYQYLTKNLRSGDIIVFHDSEKSSKTTLSVLPKILEFCLQNNYKFDLI